LDFFWQSRLLATAGNGGSSRHNKKGCDGRFSKRKNKNNPHTITYLAKAWGIGKNFPLQNVKKRAAMTSLTKKEQTTNPVNMSIIGSLKAAKVHYSAKNLFLLPTVSVSTLTKKQSLHMNQVLKPSMSISSVRKPKESGSLQSQTLLPSGRQSHGAR
jgi:hypothetical protein